MTTRTHRRWYQFRLRTLLIAGVLLCVPLVPVSSRYRQLERERPVVEWIGRVGGNVNDLESWGLPDAIEAYIPEQSWWERRLDQWLGEPVREVALGDNIKDISPLAKAESLETLILYYAYTEDLSPLSELKQLRVLVLHCPASDLSPLAELTELRVLGTVDEIADLSPLAKLTNLQVLEIRPTPEADLSILKRLTKLRALELWGVTAEDLSVIAELTLLESLYLRETTIYDLTPLRDLTNPETPNLSYTKIDDVTPLFGLKKLRKLDLTDTSVSQEQVRALQKALPECEIDEPKYATSELEDEPDHDQDHDHATEDSSPRT